MKRKKPDFMWALAFRKRLCFYKDWEDMYAEN